MALLGQCSCIGHELDQVSLEQCCDCSRSWFFLCQAVEVEAVVTGQLPAWLAGSLLVNGGGDYQRMQHMFDGYACVTKVKVAGGKAWGAQRYLQTQAYQSYKREGEMQLLQWCCCPHVSAWVVCMGCLLLGTG